jgi:hypothetical protein
LHIGLGSINVNSSLFNITLFTQSPIISIINQQVKKKKKKASTDITKDFTRKKEKEQKRNYTPF